MNTQSITRSNAQRTIIVLAVVWQIGSTFLPQLGLGEPIGNRSDSVRTLITPSGWAFAIWGPLFLGSALFAIWQALPEQRDNALLAKVGYAAAIGIAAQGAWATYTQFSNLTVISAIIILTSLAGLLIVLRGLVAQDTLSTGERWFMALVFSALAAWLTAASIVNISASLVYHGIWTGGPAPEVTAAIIGVGGVIAAIAVARSRGNPWYALVFCWALFAIHQKGGQQFDIIATACIISGALVLGAMLSQFAKAPNRRHWIGV